MAPDLRADLVLSGGGVKGIGLVGAVAALVDGGHRPQRISGTVSMYWYIDTEDSR